MSALLELHRPGSPLVLPNAWDAASAKALAAAGAPAIATTSVGVAESIGFRDGEDAPADEMLAAAARIAAAVDLPVTVDAEAGYGLPPAELAARLVEIGAAGLNFEDSEHPAKRLVDPEPHAERLRAIKEAAPELVLNARVDVFLRAGEGDDPGSLRDEAIRRGRLYAEAGADCIYPIGVRGRDAIRAVVEGTGVPVNVLAVPGGLTVSELAELGVARISFGGGLAHAAVEAAVARYREFAG